MMVKIKKAIDDKNNEDLVKTGKKLINNLKTLK
jgi:hypothetical protein